MHPIAVERLHDALDAARHVQEWMRNQSFEDYVTEPMVRYPVERQLGIIGIALGYAQNAGSTVVDDALDVERWKRVIPAYDQIDNRIVWKTATPEVPELITTLERLLAEPPRPD